MRDFLINQCPKPTKDNPDGCKFRCCFQTRGNSIILLPGEGVDEDMSHLTIIQEDYFGGQRAQCNAVDKSTCDGKYKPLDCRWFPFFPTPGGLIRNIGCPLTAKDLRECGHTEKVKASYMEIEKFFAHFLDKVERPNYCFHDESELKPKSKKVKKR